MSGEMREPIEEIPHYEDSPPKKFVECIDTTEIISDEYDDLKKKIFTCELCNIQVTSSNVLRRHKEGRKHQMRLERQGKTFACELCEITANSQSQLDAHLRSSKHKARLTRKENPFRMTRGAWILLFCALCFFINIIFFVKIYS